MSGMLTGVVPIERPSMKTRAPRGRESMYIVPAKDDRDTDGLPVVGAIGGLPEGGRVEGRARGSTGALVAVSRCIRIESVRVG